MAGRIRDEDVQAVRNALPIDAVVNDYVQLTNGGGIQLKGVCPFHDEKSASFYVHPSKGVFHCFGCGESGDSITFLMKIEHFSFAEAVERMAAQAGITLRYEEGGYSPRHQKGERTRLVEAHKVAADWYQEQLETPEAEIGRNFLAERGFDADAAKHFGVGYAPVGWEHLVRYLRGKGFSDKEILLGGLASQGQRGGLIDRFRGRLVWPIRDTTGEVIGFGARRLREDDNGPKYLNTPETPIYKKSNVLYGLDLAKKEIAKSGRAVVVEGYTDVMACHLAGVTSAVATCGTSFGEDHIKIIRRLLMDTSQYRGETVFTFDGDAAGQKAALRAFEDDQKFAARTSIAITPGGMDPCELRLAKGDDAVRELIENPVPLFEFALRSAVERHRVDTAEGRAAALEEASKIITKIKDRSIQHEYAVQLAGLLGILDEQFVVRRISQLARWQRDNPPQQRQQPRRPGTPEPTATVRPMFRLDPKDPAQFVERELLKLALQHPDLVSPAFDNYGDEEFPTPPYTAVRRAIRQAGGAAYGATLPDFTSVVREACPDDQVRSLVTELTVEPIRTRRAPDAVYAGEFLVKLRLQAVDRRIAEVRAQLQRLGNRGTPEQLTAVQGELWALQQYTQTLRTRGSAGL
ncbi:MULTISPECIES: DNA primase [unclassified Kitasatospora]|uniref:DNA primase n=1 Tax=unclassified Kitasatospora TaxID=2633591 RepID=UPI00070AC0CE|nr:MULTISPECIES: DNA primase [unclassified Kitasatospora]KQV05569.1 DNA primase [Kitasatospora sp. Root107]KRB62371.1 DNA primase [Kitasatospora sp. Root187]